MVVGIRQTSSATSTVTVTGTAACAACAANNENGSSVTQASRKTMVRATSRIVSATSFGVLRRLAASTIAIIRSKKASPGLTLTRIMIQSDSTRVPPVTALKSPPDSRITGADSPVIALSSTDAIPSITSPSAGMTSPACTKIRSPRRRSSACTVRQGALACGSLNFFAHTVARILRRLAAWALLRPSASASAKLANSTVNHNHSETARMNQADASPFPTSACTNSAAVSRLPTHTTNITGLRHCWRGESLRHAPTNASPVSCGSNRGNVWRAMPHSSSCTLQNQRGSTDNAGRGGSDIVRGPRSHMGQVTRDSGMRAGAHDSPFIAV